MLNFQETVIITIISAIVAFATSLLFRWLDRERPVWRITWDGHVSSDRNDGPFFVIVTVTNIGNGPAYDAALNVPPPHPRHSEQAVLAPGESLHGLVGVRLNRTQLEGEEYRSPFGVYVAGPELRGAYFEVAWRRPPLFWWRQRRRFSLARLASRARTQRRESRSRRQSQRTR